MGKEFVSRAVAPLSGGGLLLLTLAGCASAPAQPPGPPVDIGRVVSDAGSRTSLDVPYRLVFDWSSTEAGSRISGSGVARIEPPARARLDLFASNGERTAAAALDGDDLQVASGAQTYVPAPSILWSALGVFRPARGNALMGGRQFPNGDIEARYLSPNGEEVLYRLRDDRVIRIDIRRDGDAIEEIVVERVEGERFPRAATYRHLAEVRELRINLVSAENVETYPTDIWTLGP